MPTPHTPCATARVRPMSPGKYGSDTFRCYLMFMGPYDERGDWNDKGITGILTSQKNGQVIDCFVVDENDQIILVSDKAVSYTHLTLPTKA